MSEVSMFVLNDIREENEEFILTFEPNGPWAAAFALKKMSLDDFHKAKTIRVKKADSSQTNVRGLLTLIKKRMRGDIK